VPIIIRNIRNIYVDNIQSIHTGKRAMLTLEEKAGAVYFELPLTPLSGSWLVVARAVSRAVGQVVIFWP